MKLAQIKALITGAAGGIGSVIAKEFVDQGAGVLMTDLRQQELDAVAQSLRGRSLRVSAVAADITSHEGIAKLAATAKESGVNTLVNVAGVNPFGLFAEQSAAQAQLAVSVNVTAPILLTRSLLPFLSTLPDAHIVNVGSMLGSIAMPGYCIYGSTKAAIKAFSEALRRETSDTNVKVHYVSPRATRTPLNHGAVCEMNRRLRIRMDEPAVVARAVVAAILAGRAETYIGFPERAYRFVNMLLPGIVDLTVRRQLPIIQEYAGRRPPAAAVDERPAQVMQK